MELSLEVYTSSENTVRIFHVKHEIYLPAMASVFATHQEIH